MPAARQRALPSTLLTFASCFPFTWPLSAAALQDAAWVELPPPTRLAHAAVYDPVQDRMLVFGGRQGCVLHAEVFALALSGTAEWMEVVSEGGAPSARVGHTMIYDPVRDRIIMFGGNDGSYRNDVWVLSLSDTPSWSLITPSGTPPPPRTGHTAVYDPVGDRILVFGGTPGAENDVWELALAGQPAWMQLAPSGTVPPGRFNHSAIFDPLRNRMLVFGGGGYPYRNDLWELSLGGSPAWSLIVPPGQQPETRAQHTVVHDPVRDQMIVVGGTNYPDDFGTHDAWALPLVEGASWQALPSHARWDHSAVYDPVRDAVVVFGGHSGVIGAFGSAEDNVTWRLLLASPTWQQYSPGGGPILSAHTAVYDPVGDRMIIFGGLWWAFIIDISPSDSAWSYSLGESAAWTYLNSINWGRADHSAIIDPPRGRMLVFGGDTYYGPRLNETLALSLAGAQWSQVSASGSPPLPRRGHSAIYDPVRERMLVFGGIDAPMLQWSGNRFDDVWELELAGEATWSMLAPGGPTPSRRDNHTAVYDPLGDRMIVFGGRGDSGLLNDLWGLSLGGQVEWVPLTAAGTPPSPRAMHSALYDPEQERMLVFGGTDSPEVWALDLSNPTDALAWSSLDVAGLPPSGRMDHTAVYDPPRSRMVIFGGECSHHYGPAAFALELPDVAAIGDAPAAPGAGLRMIVQPNPISAMGEFVIDADVPRAKIEIYDLQGRLVQMLVPKDRRAVWVLDPSVPRGVYFARLMGTAVPQVVKFAVIR